MQNIFRSLTLATVVVIAGTECTFAQATAPDFDFLQGGWVDEDAGLVWGYAWEAFNPQSNNLDGQSAEWGAEDYADVGRNLDAAGPEWEDAATVAMYWQSEGFHWRLPTKGEADDALQKGFFEDPKFLDYAGFNFVPASAELLTAQTLIRLHFIIATKEKGEHCSIRLATGTMD